MMQLGDQHPSVMQPAALPNKCRYRASACTNQHAQRLRVSHHCSCCSSGRDSIGTRPEAVRDTTSLCTRPAATAPQSCLTPHLPHPPPQVLALIMRMSRLLPLAIMPGDSSTEPERWLAVFGDRQLAIRAFDSDPVVLKGLPLGAAGVLVPLWSQACLSRWSRSACLCW